LKAGALPLDLLAELAKVCAEPGPPHAADEPRDWFNELLRNQIDARFGDQQPALVEIMTMGGRALLEARSGRMHEAWRHLRNALVVFEGETLFPEARHLAHSLISAQKAYLCHRDCDDAQAEALLGAAFQDDIVLEGLPGYGFLLIHRIQLLHNVMRIHWTGGRLQPALRLGHALLAYLERPAPELLSFLPNPWSSHWTSVSRNIPFPLITSLHNQISNDMVRLSTSAEPRLMVAALGMVPTDTPSQVTRWVIFTHARLCGDSATMLASAAHLLRQGPRPSRPLWHAAAAETQNWLAAEIDRMSC